ALVERTPGRGHGRSVVGDEERLAVRVVDGVTGEVDLIHYTRRKSVEVCEGVEPEVLRRDVDVVDVAEEPAAGSAGQCRQELGLRNRRAPELEVAGRILDEDAAAKGRLHLVDVSADRVERLPPSR